ncbi:MAG: metallophosphoesterase [Ruminococcaceae bacterium]|nr:metallophosphoesterase [Oscillospiraceae bacterium]
MVHITGDIHGELWRFCEECMPGESSWTENDILIICGDFGFIWYEKSDNVGYRSNERALNTLAEKPYTILWVDGNHENFNRIYSYPENTKYGNKVHRIRDNIYHLERGRIYTIEGKRYFTFGGAYSIDRYMRQKDISYWEQEIPCNREYNQASKELKQVNYKVDYVITHTCPSEIIKLMGYYPDVHDAELCGFFDFVMYEVSFTKWFFGHWHTEEKIVLPNGKELRAIFNEIETI